MNDFANNRPRLTKIVSTLGPSSKTKEQIQALADAGMNVARINLSHGTQESHIETIRLVKALSEDERPIATMMDTRGAEIRTGVVIQPVAIEPNQEVVFSLDPNFVDPERKVIEVAYDNFTTDVKETNVILVDNGALSFDIVSIDEKKGIVIGKSRDFGSIGSRRHINLPGADIDLPSLTQKDWEDIEMGAKEGVDYVALSFIRKAEEIEEVHAFLKKRKSEMSVITKIETRLAVEKNLIEIISASDGIMVARGDLGTDIPIEELPAYQDEIVSRCRDMGKPVIVATHMLESMSTFPLPTRAEVTDVAHAATTRTDATMLSGETATGKHPVKCVEMMDRILRATEEHLLHEHRNEFESGVRNDREARAEAAVTLANSTGAHAIIVITRTGQTPRDVARFRPMTPVIACTERPEIQRKLALLFGVFPLLIKFNSPEATIEDSIRSAREAGYLKSGMRVVLLADTQAKDHQVSTVQMRDLP